MSSVAGSQSHLFKQFSILSWKYGFMTSVYLERIEYTDEFSEDVQISRDLSMAEVLQASTKLRVSAWIGGLFRARDFVVKGQD
jgi:hypothetical protein